MLLHQVIAGANRWILVVIGIIIALQDGFNEGVTIDIDKIRHAISLLRSRHDDSVQRRVPGIVRPPLHQVAQIDDISVGYVRQRVPLTVHKDLQAGCFRC